MWETAGDHKDFGDKLYNLIFLSQSCTTVQKQHLPSRPYQNYERGQGKKVSKTHMGQKEQVVRKITVVGLF